MTLGDNHAYREGRVRTVRPAERVRSFSVAGRGREAISVGGAEHFGLPASYPGLREVNVYLGWFGPLARPLQAGSLVGEVVRRVPGARPAMRIAGERVLGLVAGRRRARRRAAARGSRPRPMTERGAQLSEVHLAGVDGYEFTASFMAWAAQQPVTGRGALGPVERATALERLEEGARVGGARARSARRLQPSRSARDQAPDHSRGRHVPRNRHVDRRQVPGDARRQSSRSNVRAGRKAGGSRSGHKEHRPAEDPEASKIALTARRAASLAPSIVARSVYVRT